MLAGEAMLTAYGRPNEDNSVANSKHHWRTALIFDIQQLDFSIGQGWVLDCHNTSTACLTSFCGFNAPHHLGW